LRVTRVFSFILHWLWGYQHNCSVNNATLNRFFALHFVLPFVLAALALMHLIALHDSAGSSNPLGVSGNYDRIPFAPYYIFKDLITIFLFILVLSVFVFFMPNALIDSENYVMANPMQTPPAIVPEWYLLPFYAILRSIPNKLLGVIAMFSAILILLAMPFTDLARSRGIQFRPLSKIVFFIFIGNFLILMQLGGKHVESPFIEFGQISTVIYFAYFLIIVPLGSLFENSLIELTNNKFGTISISEKEEKEKEKEEEEEEEEEARENYNPAKPLIFLTLPMQSLIRFNFKRFWAVYKHNKLAMISFISLSIGIITAWFIRLYLISLGLDLNVFLDYSFTSAIASYISFAIKESIRELLISNTLALGAADNNMSGLSNTTGSNPVGNNPGENPGVGNNGEDRHQPVANSEQYVSSGPDKYISEKKELVWLSCSYPLRNVSPLEEALKYQGAPEPKKYLEHNLSEIGVEKDKKDLSWLIKVKEYFDEKDAGREPTDEAVKAFKERQVRYLAYPLSDSWKGPFIDFNDPSNVRRDALQDLEQMKSNVARNEMLLKALEKENFTGGGPAAKAKFYECIDKVFTEHYIKHEQYFKSHYEKEKAFYDTCDKKTIFWLLEHQTNQRKMFFKKHFDDWLMEKANKDLFQEWKKDKINQDFIEKWLKDNPNIK